MIPLSFALMDLSLCAMWVLVRVQWAGSKGQGLEVAKLLTGDQYPMSTDRYKNARNNTIISFSSGKISTTFSQCCCNLSSSNRSLPLKRFPGANPAFLSQAFYLLYQQLSRVWFLLHGGVETGDWRLGAGASMHNEKLCLSKVNKLFTHFTATGCSTNPVWKRHWGEGLVLLLRKLEVNDVTEKIK